ncbi:MAG: molybdopterin cofactor-binding domain-containing protein [Xanthobacteraceae bacterium]
MSENQSHDPLHICADDQANNPAHKASRNPTRSHALALSRRGFLAAGTGLSFAFGLAGLEHITRALAQAPAARMSPNWWLTIAADNSITIMSPAAEMGQGSFTALPAIIAEELDADWAQVRIVAAPLDAKKYGNPWYNGSLSFSSSATVRAYYQPLRIVGAQARRVLLDAVAAHWAVPVGELATEPSVVVHAASGRRISYGEVATFAPTPAQLPVIDASELKPLRRFRLIGADLPRAEVPLKVRGAAKYAIDVRVPDMLYAAVLQSPHEGGAPDVIDDSKARQMPGVTAVVKLRNGVGVLGTSVEATQAAKNALAVSWTDAPGASLDSEAALADFAAVARDKGKRGVDYFSAGDVDKAIPAASTVLHAEYRTRYVYHAQMEPLNATARVDADGMSADVWIGTQSPSGVMAAVAQELGTSPERINVHQHWLGGAYGRRSPADVALDAVRLAKHSGKPVKLIWSREDDLKGGKFRPMTAHYIEAGLDREGRIIAWHHRVIGESVVAYMAPANFEKIGGKDHILMKGSVLDHYGFPHRRAEFVRQIRGARLAPWRGVGVGHNLLAIEGFIDEIAQSQGKDPLAYRLQHTQQSPRASHLLRTVAEMADWGRPRPGRALGLAIEEKDETLVTGIAEISLDAASGRIRVHNFWAAIDCGVAVQPRNVAAQIEGGIVYGLGHVLREEITIKNGRVQQSNFLDYQVMRMEDVPEIKVAVVSTDNMPTGVGEDGVPLTAACLGNAFAALTRVRLRELPMSPPRVKAALAGKA